MAGSQIRHSQLFLFFFPPSVLRRCHRHCHCRFHDKHSPSVDSHKIKCTHTDTHSTHTPKIHSELGVTAALVAPPFFRGAYAAQIFLQQFRFVCWVNLLSVMRPFSTRNFLILFHFRLNCPPCSALLLYFLSYLLYFFFRDRFKLFSVETGTETESQSIQIGTWLTASN